MIPVPSTTLFNTPVGSTTVSIAHYIIRAKHNFWLLERKDTNAELALFDSYKKALSRAESLAAETLPSLLEIHNEANVEQRRYPFVTIEAQEKCAERYE